MGEFFEMQEEGLLCLRCGGATFETEDEAANTPDGFRLCADCASEGYTVEMVMNGEEPDDED